MWQRESRQSREGRKKQRLIQLLHESSAASPDSGLLSNWSKNKRFLEPRSNNYWLHHCMFDFRCNFKIMAAAKGDANGEFFAALTSSLEDFIQKLLKGEQTECIRRIVCLKEDVLAVLLTGFGKSVICQLIPKVRMKKLHPSSGFKTSVVVVSPLEYIRKQQVENLKKEDFGITAATIGESVKVDREIETGHVDIVYGNAEQWLSDRWRKVLRAVWQSSPDERFGSP